MTEYRGLDPNAEAGDVFATEEEGKTSLLRVDSAADATIVKPGVIRKSDLAGDRKTWSGAGRTSFSTSHSGTLKGKVKWNKRNKEDGRGGETSFQVHGHVSEQCQQNLLSLESLFESDQWKYATFQLDKEGKSYLYGEDGKRVLLERIAGRKGWWIKVRHGDCKSEICSRIYGLIRVQGKRTLRTGPLDQGTRSTKYVVQNNNKFTICNHTPYDRSQHLLPHEVDIYNNLPHICKKCHPTDILGTLTLRTTPKTQATLPASKACNVYVTSIHNRLTEEDIYEMFDDFGRISSIEFPAKTGAGRRTDAALVTFRKPREAKRAHRRMKGFQIWGRPVMTSLEKFLSPHRKTSREAIKVEEVERNDETIGVAEETKPICREVKVVEEVEPAPKEELKVAGDVESTPSVGTTSEETEVPEEEEAVKVAEEVERSETAPKEELKVAGDVESTPSDGTASDETEGPEEEEDQKSAVDDEGVSIETTERAPTDEPSDDDDNKADKERDGRGDNSDEDIERTVTAKAIHLRLRSGYYERAKKSYQGKDKITLTDVGEVFQLHEIYNHRSLYVLRQMFRIQLPAKYSGFACDACDAGKMARANSHKVYSRDRQSQKAPTYVHLARC